MFEKEAEEYIKEHTFFDEEYGVPSLDVGSKTIFKDGVKFGLKQHSYDYLVKTINLKKKYEKQIQIDAEQIRALQKQNGELTDRCRELESQIEKMKCCGNCKYQCSFLFQDEIDCAKNGLPKWELAE